VEVTKAVFVMRLFGELNKFKESSTSYLRVVSVEFPPLHSDTLDIYMSRRKPQLDSFRELMYFDVAFEVPNALTLHHDARGSTKIVQLLR